MPARDYGFLRDREAFIGFLDRKGVQGKQRDAEIAKYDQMAKGLLVEEKVAELQARQGSGFLQKAVGELGAGALHLMNTATAGYYPKIMGALAGPEVGREEEALLEATRVTNPGASNIGDIGGYFAPQGGVSGLMRLGAGAATRATLTHTLAKATVEKGLAARAAAQFAQNLTGAAGGITALRLVEERKDTEGKKFTETIGTRLHQAKEDILSPTTFITSAAFGGITARLSGPRSTKSLQYLFDRYRKETGKEISPDIVTDNAELQNFLSAAQATPGLATEVAKVRKELVQGLDQVIDGIAYRVGATPRGGTSSSQAGRAVRKLIGADEGGIEASGGPVTGLRRGSEGAALEVEGAIALTPFDRRVLQLGLRRSIRGKSRVEDRGGEMTAVVRKFGRLLRDSDVNNPRRTRPITVKDLEAIRKELGNIAWGWGRGPMDARVAERGRVEARRFYDTITTMIKEKAPRYGQALEDASDLRMLETALSEVKVSDLNDRVIRSFFGSGRFNIKRWESAERYTSPEDISAMRGWYLWNLVRSATNKDGALNKRTLEGLFSKDGMYNKQAVDRIIPGVRDQLMDIAELSDIARKGILKESGSQTATRVAYGGGLLGVTSTLMLLIQNPFARVTTGLQIGGLAWLVKRMAQSMISGRGAQAVSRMGQGGAPPYLSRFPGMVQNRGGAVPLIRESATMVQSPLSLAGSGLRSLIQNQGQGEQQ